MSLLPMKQNNYQGFVQMFPHLMRVDVVNVLNSVMHAHGFCFLLRRNCHKIITAFLVFVEML